MDETAKMESQMGMDETAKMENHLSSAAAFVEGGIQEACDDACSICLEAFCDSDPSTVTGCTHEFHLQCILEWCQRSSQCPMCWQPISFKDPTSQELLEGVERERSLRVTKPRNTAIFHHPTLGDFELQHLPVGANDADLEERIFQHLAAAAAMGRTHLARREGRRGRSGARGRPQYLFFSADTDTIPAGPAAASSNQRESEDAYVPPGVTASSSAPLTAVDGDLSSSVSRPFSIQSSEVPISILQANNSPTYSQAFSDSRSSSSQSIQNNQERDGPSEFQSFSESFKSRLSAVSMKYKESITKTTRGWRERFFSRNSAITDANSQNRTDVTPIVTTISHMIEHLHARDGSGADDASGPHSLEGHLASEAADERLNERHTENIQKDNTSAPYAAASGSS